MCDEDTVPIMIVGFCFGLIALMAIMALAGNLNNHLSQETMQDICQKLNPDGPKEFNAYADREQHLVCEYPSYDNTQSIVFKSNSDNDR